MSDEMDDPIEGDMDDMIDGLLDAWHATYRRTHGLARLAWQVREWTGQSRHDWISRWDFGLCGYPLGGCPRFAKPLHAHYCAEHQQVVELAQMVYGDGSAS